MTIGSKIILTLFLPTFIFTLWGLYNIVATRELIQEAVHIVEKYQSKNKNHGGWVDIDCMIYDYIYIFLRPWIRSAIRPQYREVLKEWMK